MDTKFTWGDSARFLAQTELSERSGELVAVCGVVTISSEGHAKNVLCGTVGALAYLIEFTDGYSIEVTEDLLQPVDRTAS